MQQIELDPRELIPNPWNTNELSPEDESRLDASIKRFGFFKPVIVRELPLVGYEIIGGAHRVLSAIRLGIKRVPVVNLGLEVPDKTAKEISVIDNGRYGQDDVLRLNDLLSELGSKEELAEFMPFDVAALDAMIASSSINLDELGLEDDEDAPVIEKETKPIKTHVVMRFKVPVADQHIIEKEIKKIIKEQVFDDRDSMINAGDALVWKFTN